MSSRTILGPLTTTFTPPSSCTVITERCSTCLSAWLAQSCYATIANGVTNSGVQDNTDCWPPRSTGVKTTLPLSGWGFYSPGLACPSGMATACSATGVDPTGWSFQYPLLAQETAVGCCPDGYSCGMIGTEVQTCIQTFTEANMEGVTCVSGATSTTSWTIPATITPEIGIKTTISTFSLVAPMIQINWQASDLLSITSSAATVTAVSTSRPTSPTPTSQSLQEPSASSQSTGMPTSLKVTIAVCIILGALIIGVLTLIIHRNRTLGRRRIPRSAHELSAENKRRRNVTELPTEEKPTELSSQRPTYELL